MIKGSKELNALRVLQEENANLESTITEMARENRAQQTAMRENIKQLCEQNAELQARIAELEKSAKSSLVCTFDA